MKYGAVITVFSLICLVNLVSANENAHEDIINYVKGVIEGCKTKMNTPDDIFEDVWTGKYDKGGANEMGMCHINCMMKEFGALKDGKAEAFETFKEHMHEEEAKEVLEKCQQETGETDCETGYKVYMCMKANSEKMFKPQ
ncbi:general odorant-binding protein 56a-like [Eupeodes corollae]|uniref:general odorant-binding protein 56a-like n=1 Tax=Eupeodes corollae TaxID=290404 RepID=UPI00249021F4|nr:general odorant-binding protein 56a-like [Eupeodes corollae]